MFNFELSLDVEAWMLEFDPYGCWPYWSDTCAPDQILTYMMPEGSTIHLIVDTNADGPGTGTLTVTQE